MQPLIPLLILWLLAGGKLGNTAPAWPNRKSPPPRSPPPKTLAPVKPAAAAHAPANKPVLHKK